VLRQRAGRLRGPGAGPIREVGFQFGALYRGGRLRQRHLREGALTPKAADMLHDQFLDDIRETWVMLPVTDLVLRKVGLALRALPRNVFLRAADAIHNVFLRAADAIHIVTALDAGFDEIWTNDRHLLAAAGHFELNGRQVSAT
jgi:predicted nucleic acid-binding protein